MTEACDPFWRVADVAAFIAAIDADLGDRARTYADKVRKGAMHQKEADHVIGLVRDIRSDLAHYFAPVPEDELQRPPRADPLFTWTDKVRWIRGEREDLAKLPELVAKGRVTAEAAKRSTAMFGTLHRLYWRGMFMWEPPEGPAADYLRQIHAEASAGGIAYRAKSDAYSSQGAKLYRQMVRDHMAALEAENDDAQGRLVA